MTAPETANEAYPPAYMRPTSSSSAKMTRGAAVRTAGTHRGVNIVRAQRSCWRPGGNTLERFPKPPSLEHILSYGDDATVKRHIVSMGDAEAFLRIEAMLPMPPESLTWRARSLEVAEGRTSDATSSSHSVPEAGGERRSCGGPRSSASARATLVSDYQRVAPSRGEVWFRMPTVPVGSVGGDSHMEVTRELCGSGDFEAPLDDAGAKESDALADGSPTAKTVVQSLTRMWPTLSEAKQASLLRMLSTFQAGEGDEMAGAGGAPRTEQRDVSSGKRMMRMRKEYVVMRLRRMLPIACFGTISEHAPQGAGNSSSVAMSSPTPHPAATPQAQLPTA